MNLSYWSPPEHQPLPFKQSGDYCGWKSKGPTCALPVHPSPVVYHQGQRNETKRNGNVKGLMVKCHNDSFLQLNFCWGVKGKVPQETVGDSW